MPLLAKIKMVSSLVLVLTTSDAMAASYCAVFAWGKQCDFVTYEDCLRAAGSHGGCEIHSKEDKMVSDTAPFCLVTPYGTKCIFDDAQACRLAALIENSELIKQAECVANPKR